MAGVLKSTRTCPLQIITFGGHGVYLEKSARIKKKTQNTRGEKNHVILSFLYQFVGARTTETVGTKRAEEEES